MASVTLKNVVKRFGDATAVNDLSLEVADREFAVLVGSSGCGKTTALRMIAGLETVTSGDIFIGDTRVNDLPPKDRDIAMVFQSYALYPHLNVHDNMAFGLRIRNVPDREIAERVREAADILGLADYLKRKPRELSGGQRQRVALGRAIVRTPRLFLFDEPLSNLDAKLRVAMRAEISKLHRRLGATIIYVTHDQVEAMTMADRIFIMSHGVLQQQGTPMEVYAKPQNRFVAGFIGSPAMNFIPARLRAVGTDIELDAESFRVRLPAGFEPLARPWLDKPVVFGLRPEDIVAAPAARTATGTATADDTAMTHDAGDIITARADVVETLGSEMFVHLASGPHSLVARMEMPESPPVEGDTLTLQLRMARTHLFDPDSSTTII